MKNLIVIFFAISGLNPNVGQCAAWREINNGLPISPVGVSQLVVQPASQDIYAVTAYGIFKSTDGAGSWTQMTALGNVSALAIDPKNPATFYSVTNTGLVKSVDAGETWTNTGPDSPIRSIMIDPDDSSTLYLTSSDANRNALIFRSTDAGATWNAIDPGLPRGLGWPGLPTIAPTHPPTLYLPFNSFNNSMAGIAKTTDRGQTWRIIRVPSALGINSLTVDPSNPSIIYAAVGNNLGGGILKSTDAGENWIAVNSGIPLNSFVGPVIIDASATSTIYSPYTSFGSNGGLIKSTDGGAHWLVVKTGLPPPYTFALTIDPAGRSTIYAANGLYTGGIIKTTDDGASWNAAAGPAVIDLRSLAVHPSDSATLYAGTRDGIFKSIDAGATWSKLVSFQIQFTGGPAVARTLVIDPVNPNIVYAQTESLGGGCSGLTPGGPTYVLLFKSTDGGASWSDSISTARNGCWWSTFFTPDPADPNTLYLGELNSDGVSLFKTTDGGKDWYDIWQLFTDDFPDTVYAVAIDPSHRETVYAGLGPLISSGGVLKSTDGGVNWSNSGLSGFAIPALAIDPANHNVVYAATAGAFNSSPPGFQDMFKSADGGATWSTINHGLDSLLKSRFPITALIIDPSDSNIVYLASSGGGVFRTIDGGVNWTAFNQGLANLDVRVLALSSGTLHAGTSGGVFTIRPDSDPPQGKRD